jgi:AraC family transcriptional regulator, arabinose operon regulatory protein
MDGLVIYMEYLMKTLKFYRVNLNMLPTQRSAAFEVRGLGINETMSRGIVWRQNGTQDYLLMHFHSAVSLEVDGSMQKCPANTFIIWQPGITHHYGNDMRGWRHSWLHCDGISIGRSLAATDIPLNRPMFLADASLIQEALQPIYTEISQNRRQDRTITEALVQIWIRRLHRVIRWESTQKVSPRILAAQSYMDRNSSAPLTLETVATFAGLSASHFSAEFRKYAGVAPMRHLLELRLSRASYLLADKNLSVAEIASQTGFNDPLYFSRQFKKRFGQSPRYYRQNLS